MFYTTHRERNLAALRQHKAEILAAAEGTQGERFRNAIRAATDLDRRIRALQAVNRAANLTAAVSALAGMA